MEEKTIPEYLQEVEEAPLSTKEQLENFRLLWLSKKGILPNLFTKMKDIAADKRKEFGQEINRLKELAEQKFEAAREHIETSAIKTKNAGLDISLDGMPINTGSLHPLTIIRNRMVDIFAGIGFTVAEDVDIVDDWHNFTALNIPTDHPARDMADTFFISQNPDIVLRTHTSPVQIKLMETQQPPIRSVMPGRVYRKDSDATHSPNFHQMEGLYVDEGVSFSDLKQTLFYFVEEMFGEGTEIRFRPSYFPFTEVSAEMDILWKKVNSQTGKEEPAWLEVLGCGMVDPNVLENCGIDSNRYTGFAFGMGIERIAMVKYNIQDIRLFYENDLRFLRQFVGE
ncbi:MAG: phenylalanine--tRNA ligase subunit alpha [Bacteroidetes bacterium]|nr:phenylalanine--tRNA ligase subunit alpha [Bacteroidota bacterium]